eukprot:5469000-Prymnesium_polylepis.1
MSMKSWLKREGSKLGDLGMPARLRMAMKSVGREASRYAFHKAGKVTTHAWCTTRQTATPHTETPPGRATRTRVARPAHRALSVAVVTAAAGAAA